MNITEYESRKQELILQIADEVKRHHEAITTLQQEHEKAMEGLQVQYNEAEKMVNLLCAELDTKKIQQAKKVIHVNGYYHNAGMDANVIVDEILLSDEQYVWATCKPKKLP